VPPRSSPSSGSASRSTRSSSTTATDTKYGFGRLIDPTRAEPLAVAKLGRPVIVVMAVEEFERLKALDAPAVAPAVMTR